MYTEFNGFAIRAIQKGSFVHYSLLNEESKREPGAVRLPSVSL